MVESECDAVAVGRTYLLPPLSSGGALVVQPWLRFHIPLIEPRLAGFPHPALGQDITPSPTAGRSQARSGVRARSARRGAGVDVNAGAKMHRLDGAKIHQRRWQEDPERGAFSSGIRLVWDYQPACRSWPGVSGACSD